MSFVVTTPDEIQAAARNLAGIRSLLAESSASAAAPTAGMVAAAQDQVSLQVAAFLGGYGQEYQAISAQAQVFHEQFVNLVNSGAGAYLGTELANAQQNLMNAVNGPVQGLLGNSAAASGVVAAAASGLTAAPSAALPLLGGAVDAIMRGGAPVGQAFSGAVGAVQNGSVAPLLSGQLGPGLQTISGGIVGLPTGLAGLERALAPGLLAPAASTGLASVGGPYQTLVADTAANLNILGGALMANPLPVLHQFLANQIGYAQAIAAGAEYILANFPAVLASLPANIQAFIQAVLAFNPVPYVQQFIAHQMAYAQIIATSLQNAAHDFGAGLQAMPAAFQSALQALQSGDITGAVTDISQAFVNLFVTGVNVTSSGNVLTPPGIIATVTSTGVLGDLVPILAIPAMAAQDFTNLLPPGTIPARMSQNVTNLLDTLSDTSLTAQMLLTVPLPPPIPPTASLSVNLVAGLPVALTIEALGPSYNAGGAASAAASQFVGQLQTGDLGGAIATAIDAPAVVADAFLNGQSTLPIGFNLGGNPAVVNLPLNGLLAPPTPYTATVSGVPFGPFTVPVGGTPISGLATGLLSYAPQQLARAITP